MSAPVGMPWLALAGSMPLGSPRRRLRRLIAARPRSRGHRPRSTRAATPWPERIDAHPDARQDQRPRGSGAARPEIGERRARSSAAAFAIRDAIGGDGHAAVITMGEEGASRSTRGTARRRSPVRARSVPGRQRRRVARGAAGATRTRRPWPGRDRASRWARRRPTRRARGPACWSRRARASSRRETGSASSADSDARLRRRTHGPPPVRCQPDHASFAGPDARIEAGHSLDAESRCDWGTRTSAATSREDAISRRQRAVDDQLVAQRLDHVDTEIDRWHPVAAGPERLGAQADDQLAVGQSRALEHEIAGLDPPIRANPRRRFIGGLPMKPATNTFAGRS